MKHTRVQKEDIGAVVVRMYLTTGERAHVDDVARALQCSEESVH